MLVEEVDGVSFCAPATADNSDLSGLGWTGLASTPVNFYSPRCDSGLGNVLM
jgi:hypothetical protein